MQSHESFPLPINTTPLFLYPFRQNHVSLLYKKPRSAHTLKLFKIARGRGETGIPAVWATVRFGNLFFINTGSTRTFKLVAKPDFFFFLLPLQEYARGTLPNSFLSFPEKAFLVKFYHLVLIKW